MKHKMTPEQQEFTLRSTHLTMVLKQVAGAFDLGFAMGPKGEFLLANEKRATFPITDLLKAFEVDEPQPEVRGEVLVLTMGLLLEQGGEPLRRRVQALLDCFEKGEFPKGRTPGEAYQVELGEIIKKAEGKESDNAK